MVMLNLFLSIILFVVLACVHSYKYSTNSGLTRTIMKTKAIIVKKIPRRISSDSFTRYPMIVSERPQIPTHQTTVMREYPSDLYLWDKGI